jgi:hypothetical protein
MKITTKTTILLTTALFVSSAVFAQPQDDNGGFLKDLRRQFFGERKEERKEFRDDMKDAREELKKEIKERRDWMASTTATGTAPAPWKDFRKEVKDVRKDFIQDRKEDVKKFIGAGFLQNATATAILAQKLGTTTAALQQMAASGTLHTFMKTKVGSDDINKFIPKSILGATNVAWATNTPIVVTLTQGTTTFSTTTLPKVDGWRGFFQRFFGR